MKEIFGKLAELTRDDKVLLLTHTDMDGAGAAVILSSFLHEDQLDVRHCPNSTMSKDILEVFTSGEYKNYDLVIVTDISCNAEDAEKINEIEDIDRHLILLDHHPTAVWLNKYKWACVRVEALLGSERLRWYGDADLTLAHSSGTSLMFDYADYRGLLDGLKDKEFLAYFTFLVSISDTWDWKNILNGVNTECRELASLCAAYGVEYFTKRYAQKINRRVFVMFDETDKLFLDVTRDKAKKFVENVKGKCREAFLMIDHELYDVVYIFNNNFMPDVFAYMSEAYPDKDLYIMDTGSSVSFRSTKSDVDVSEIAKRYGGGGHKGASGISIPEEVLRMRLEDTLHGSLLNKKV